MVKTYKLIYKVIALNGLEYNFTDFMELDEGFAKVQIDDKWGILTPYGVVWGEVEFSNIADSFHEDMIRVEKNGKFGYANRKTAKFIRCMFDSAEDFKYGVAEVVWRGKKMLINTEGKIVG